MLPASGKELATAEAMIEALGGVNEVAEMFKLDSYRVPSMWRRRGRIPPIYRPQVADMLRSRGFTIPESFLLPPTKATS